MSNPIRELERLSVGPMASTTGSQGQQRRRPRNQRAPQQGSQVTGNPGLVPSIESDAGPSTSHTTVRGHSGLFYDVRQLPRGKADLAAEGLHSTEFFVTPQSRVVTTEDGTESYHGIHLGQQGGRTRRRAENYGIRIFQPEDGSSRVTCSCSDSTQTGSVCKHHYVSCLLRLPSSYY